MSRSLVSRLDWPFALFFVVIGVLLATLGLAGQVHPDEHQYISSAVLVGDLTPYRDFFYSQTPYFIYALHLPLELFAPDGPGTVVTARLFNLAWTFLFFAVLIYLLLEVGRRKLLVAALILSIITSTYWELAIRPARNDMMGIALFILAIASVRFAVRATEDKRSAAWFFVAGLLITTACLTRQAYFFACVGFGLFALLPDSRDYRTRLATAALPMAGGALVASLPALPLIIPNWENFYYATVEFHQTHHAYWTFGDPPFKWSERLYIVVGTIIETSFVLLSLALMFGAWRRRRELPTLLSMRTPNGQFALLNLIVGVTLGASLALAAPLHWNYVAPVLPLLAILIGILFAPSEDERSGTRTAHSTEAIIVSMVLIGGALLSAAGLANRGLASHLRMIFIPEKVWTPIYPPYNSAPPAHLSTVFEVSDQFQHEMQLILGEPDPKLKVATIMSVIPIEAGFGFYREFAGAPFFFRTNDRMDPAEVKRLNGLSFSTVDQWMEQEGVRAVLTGYTTVTELNMYEFAHRSGFVCYRFDLRGHQKEPQALFFGQLWVHPELATPDPESIGRTCRVDHRKTVAKPMAAVMKD